MVVFRRHLSSLLSVKSPIRYVFMSALYFRLFLGYIFHVSCSIFLTHFYLIFVIPRTVLVRICNRQDKFLKGEIKSRVLSELAAATKTISDLRP